MRGCSTAVVASEGSSSPVEAELEEAAEMVGVVEEPWLLPEVAEIEKGQPHWVSEQHEHWSSDDVVEHVDQLVVVVVDYNAAVEVGEIPASFDDVAVGSSGSYYAAVGVDSVGEDGDCCDGEEGSDGVVDGGLDSVAVVEVGAADVAM